MNQQQYRKVESLCNEYNMTQCIDELTHCTESSISIIDLLFVTNKTSVLTTGVEPRLGLTMRYHCLVFGVFNFLKPKFKNIKRTIRKYDQGDYNELRNSLTNYNWNSIHVSNINTYAENIACVITDNASRVIPSKTVIVNFQEPPWMNCTIKKEIRCRKRLYKKPNYRTMSITGQNLNLLETM